MAISMFAEEVSLKYLFIGFKADGKEKVLTKELDRPLFVDWSEITIDNGEVFAKGISLSRFKFILVGAIGSNTDIYSSVQESIKTFRIKSFFYGTPSELNNKVRQTTIMNLHRISQIKTVIAKAGKVTADSLIKSLKLPIVSKIIHGSQGKGVIKHDTKAELEAFLKKDPDTLFIFQEFIPNNGDYRVFFLRKELIYAIQRISKDKKEFRNNVSLGGTQDFIELESDAKKLALKACNAMDFDVTGVDLIQHKKTKKWYIMEINAAPQFDGPEFEMVAKALIAIIK